MTKMIAHTRLGDENTVQTVQSHCQGTAIRCAKYASSIGATNIGKLLGLLHDAGKFTSAFQERIRGGTQKPDHSSQGAKYVYEMAEGPASRLIARIILSHHGVHDWLTSDDEDYFSIRLQKDNEYSEVLDHVYELAPEKDIKATLDAADEEFRRLENKCRQLACRKKESYAFYMGGLERFLLSCLIDADRTDTADFRENTKTENVYDVVALWSSMKEKMRAKLETFSRLSDPISNRRRNISDRCASFASQPVRICRLIVPTGGGKTLSSLRFAIDYCQKFGKQKIVYCAPFMSILKQNSGEFRKIVGDDCFIEHHSDFFAKIESDEELHEYELRTEKWDAPVVATTMVQFLNALFLGKTSSIRRMHRLSDAVVIVDEVQSIPLKCTHLFNLAINFLSHICGTTVVLCSATQPTMEKTTYPLLLDENNSMTGDTTDDFETFRRVAVVSKVNPYGFSYDEASDFCAKRFEENGNLLMIVNTKAAAKAVFTKIRERNPRATVVHLSANLCPAHLEEKIEEMRNLLDKRAPIICVTTQLIEAGVDISFHCVVRSLAGMDSMAQAAGRCNRHGEMKTLCPVYLIRLKEENVSRLEGIQTKQRIAQQILDSSQFFDCLSFETQSLFFEKLYKEENNKLSFPVEESGCKTDLLELLSLNKNHFKMAGEPKTIQFCSQAFKTAGNLFEVIDSKTQDVIAPYNDEARNIINELDDERVSPERCRTLLRKAQKYAVSVYDGQNRKLHENHAVRELSSHVFALEDRFYDANFGVVTEGAEQETLIY